MRTKLLLVCLLLYPLTLTASSVIGKPWMDTGAFVCDATNHQLTYVFPKDTKVTQVQIWMGMDMNGVSDFAFMLLRQSDGGIIGHTNWDHYADPTQPHHVIYSFAPHQIKFRKGDAAQLNYSCTDIFRFGIHGHLVVMGWEKE